MTFSLPNILQLIVKGVETFRRFPLALLASILTTCIAIYFIAYEPDELKGVNLVLAKLAATAMLGVFVFTALRLLEHSAEKRTQLVVLGLGVLGLIAYYFTLPEEMNDFDALLYVFRHIFLILLFFVSILWTPFLKSNLPNVDYWQYTKEVLFSLVMTVLFSIVVVIGVNAALFAVEKLFDFSIQGKYYFMLDVFIVGVLSVAYFLSQIPEKPLLSQATTKPPRVEKFFTKYILTALTGIYFVILYAYTFKVLVTMDWPKGVLAWLIVIFSMVAVLTYLFWTHFATHQTSRWRKWIWLAVLLQTLMLFAAIGMRILEYSWTENRYMVLMLGVWLAGISLYFLVYKKAKIKWIFVSLSALIAISQVGPLSAYAVSKKAQTLRLEVQLLELKKTPNVQNAPATVRYDISDITQYLFDRYGIKALEAVFPKITAAFKVLDSELKSAEKTLRDKIHTNSEMAINKAKDYEKIKNIFKDKPMYLPHFITHELGFKFINAWEHHRGNSTNKRNVYFSIEQTNRSVRVLQDIRGYDYMSHFYGDTQTTYSRSQLMPVWNFEDIGVFVQYEKDVISIQTHAGVIVLDMKDFVDKLTKVHGLNHKKLKQKALTLSAENDSINVKIEFENIGQMIRDKNENIHFSSNIFFKLKGEK